MLEKALNIVSVNQPGKYLGFNFNHSRNKAFQFQTLLDKVNLKLQGWKAKLLSQASRLNLIKSVLNSLPLYIFSCFKVPEFV